MPTFQLMKILPQVYVVLNGYDRICRKMEIDLDLYQIFLLNIDWMIHSFLTRLSKMKSRCQSYSKWNLLQSTNTMAKKMNSNTDCYLNNNEKISFEFFINMTTCSIDWKIIVEKKDFYLISTEFPEDLHGLTMKIFEKQMMKKYLFEVVKHLLYIRWNLFWWNL